MTVQPPGPDLALHPPDPLATRPSRAVVEVVRPIVDAGRFAAKATVYEPVTVLADVFVDGHDQPDASVWVRGPGHDDWTETPMEDIGNDRWRATFRPDALGTWEYRVAGWHARYESWRHATVTKLANGLDVSVELIAGAELLEELTDRVATGGGVSVTRSDGKVATAVDLVAEAITSFRAGRPDPYLTDRSLRAVVRRHLNREPQAESPPLRVTVEPVRARFSAWYEFFPRSTVDGSDRHATLTEAIDRLPYIAALGFDVVYLPPVHPIGRQIRKGRNNTLEAAPDDVGSPWAIGSPEGGHTDVHPDLGTVADITKLADAASARGLTLALDIAFQCAPDHPWVTEHPEWFKHRADGTIQYAENPPKKYQDIYPFDFESDAWRELWDGLRDVVLFWVDAGISVFRVDNPHTKPFPFWEWLIAEVKRAHPDIVFLAEAFTRPRVMERLGKLGFSQSYTYFTWRQARWEIEQYFDDLATRTVDYFRPNAWPNTPDILTEQLQAGGRPLFAARAILAATLAPSWGVYGPAFELVEHTAVRTGSEEYLDSEKYQRRQWQLDQPQSLAPLLRTLNEIRRRHPALQHLRGLRFHRSDNDALICYSKLDSTGTDRVLVIVNLDATEPQAGTVDIDLAALDLPYGASYRVHDELGGDTYEWHGALNWVRIEPGDRPAHVFSVEPLEPPEAHP